MSARPYELALAHMLHRIALLTQPHGFGHALASADEHGLRLPGRLTQATWLFTQRLLSSSHARSSGPAVRPVGPGHVPPPAGVLPLQQHGGTLSLTGNLSQFITLRAWSGGK